MSRAATHALNIGDIADIPLVNMSIFHCNMTFSLTIFFSLSLCLILLDYSEFSGPLTTTSYLLTTRNAGTVLAGILMNLSNVSPEIRDAELKRLKTRYDWIKVCCYL